MIDHVPATFLFPNDPAVTEISSQPLTPALVASARSVQLPPKNASTVLTVALLDPVVLLAAPDKALLSVAVLAVGKGPPSVIVAPCKLGSENVAAQKAAVSNDKFFKVLRGGGIKFWFSTFKDNKQGSHPACYSSLR